MTILPPPEFMPPSPYYPAEGYWADIGSKDRNAYMPVVSKKVWKDKTKFLQALDQIEKSMPYRSGYDDEWGDFYVRGYRGMSTSRIDGSALGAAEFSDETQNIKWPDVYAQHYIGKYNVMPTKRFFDYVVYRSNNPFPGTPKASSVKPVAVAKPVKPAPRPTNKPTKKPAKPTKATAGALIKCPPGKIVNPATNRCVLRTGKIGKQILAAKHGR